MVFRRALPALVACLLLTAMATVAAHAAPNDNSSRSTVTIANGTTVSQGTAGFDSSGTQADADSRTSASPVAATNGAVAASAGADVVVQVPDNALAGGLAVGISSSPSIPRAACPAGQTGFFVVPANGSGAFQVVCVPNQAAPPPRGTAVSPLQLAEQASAAQPWPNLTVSFNPGIGLTGLPSWFWCAGSANMPDASASAGPLTVTVRATLVDVEWSFGDGYGASGDLGRAFPAQSDVQHVYQTDSFELSQGFTPTASVRWRVSYSVNGGTFIDLGFKSRDYSRSYVVEQLQPQAVSVP
jgi:hypothetical protein